MFSIDAKSGEIKVAADIDAESKELIDRELSYSFKVVAKEIYDKEKYPDLTPEETEHVIELPFSILDINVVNQNFYPLKTFHTRH